MKKSVLVNCFASSNEMRVEPIREVLEEQGYETIYAASDYHHALKQYVDLDKSIRPIHVRPYKKNLSFDRLLAHKEFSRKVYEFLCKEQPELIYIKFPPNTLVKAAYDYKKDHDCKIILDIFDLWPESLPVPAKVKKVGKPLLSIWTRYRDRYISCADLVLTECDMYREVLGDRLPENTHTLYLAKEDIKYEFHPAVEGKIRLCFLGGINNLINIDLIGNVIENLIGQGYEVSLDIIGDGVSKDELIAVAESKGCIVHFHGIIFDENEKYRIMSQCDMGLNLIKDSVRIALSIKSIEYFRAGLGVINNVGYDTWKIIDNAGCGFNIKNEGEENYIVVKSMNEKKRNSREVFHNRFEKNVFIDKLCEYLEKIEGEGNG